MVDEKTIQMVTERHRGVQRLTDGVPGALVHRERLEAVGVDPGPDPHVARVLRLLGVLDELLLHPAESELCITVVVLEAVPAHHVQDVEHTVALTVDAVQDRVFVAFAASLASVSTRQITGEALDLLSALAKYFC